MFSKVVSTRIFLTILLVFKTFAAQNPVAATDFIMPDGLEVIDAEVLKFMERWQIPGATVALAKGDKLVYAKGFGYANEDQEMNPNNLFRIASLSKPLTAMAVMKLAQDSSLSLESKVFGPEGILNSALYANIQDPRIMNITVQNLLEHTAGWDREISPEGDPMFSPVKIATSMNMPAPADAVTVIRYMLQQPLDFEPGTRFAYSNLGYNILGRVIEQVTQLPYETFVRTAILQPLGITNMFLGHNLYEEKLQREVRYYDLKERRVNSVSGNGQKVDFPYGGFNLEAMDAHGGWIASAPDLIRLLLALDEKPVVTILNPDQLAVMTTPSQVALNYAKGWFVNKQGNKWHTGALYGTASLMANLNNGFKWVLLLNARPEDSRFYPELDRLMWNAVGKVETWPEKDLFKPENPELVVKEAPAIQ